MLIALSYGWTVTVALLAVFAVIFPALMTGLIAFAIAQAIGERQENEARRHGRGQGQ